MNTVRIDDVISCDHFQVIKKHILDALLDSDEQIVVGFLFFFMNTKIRALVAKSVKGIDLKLLGYHGYKFKF
jgi:hypothetical protein